MNPVINWKDLGSPTEPGKYTVKGYGEVSVTQEEIDQAAELGGSPDVEIVETTTFGNKLKQFIISNLIPA
jgi:hypothetical protein